MSTTKNRSVKTPAAIKLDDAGNQIQTNYAWLKVGLGRGELAALKHIGQRLWKKPNRVSSGRTIKAVLGTALMHWEKIEAYFFSDGSYWRREGFLCGEMFMEDSLRRKYPKGIKADGRTFRARKGEVDS